MTRFEAIVNGDPGMLPHPDGSYVLYSDAQGLEDLLAGAIEVNTAAYMLGVEAGKKDAAMLYKARIEALEAERAAMVNWIARAHDACAAPSRPRQAVGEMLAAWLDKFAATEATR